VTFNHSLSRASTTFWKSSLLGQEIWDMPSRTVNPIVHPHSKQTLKSTVWWENGIGMLFGLHRNMVDLSMLAESGGHEWMI
jgi:hypothetical protein